MDVHRLIRDLTRPEAYPHGAPDPAVRQTHISVVFLAGPYAYKVKKAVDLGFLDFTTLERRLRYCREEVTLNRRLAPDVYLGVVPIVEREGRLELEGEGEAVEYAVKMRRLPADATMLEHLRAGRLAESSLEEAGRRIAEFHARAARGPEVSRYRRYEVVAGNARENLDQSRGHVGTCVSAEVFEKLGERLQERLAELEPLIEARASADVPRDTHGDLHLDHVYLFPDEAPPNDLVIIDCIEFNQRFRYADPVADVAFLAMDLQFRGRRDLADLFARTYLRAAGDDGGWRLLPFYVAYRAAVRAKVEGMLAGETEVPEPQRRRAERQARAHWLLALSELEAPERRPALVLVGGLPGTGKTTLAEGLAERAGFHVVSSDRVRKGLAGVGPGQSAAAPYGEGIYTPEWNDRTYAECLERALDLLHRGERVIVDASFHERARRRAFLDAARGAGVRSACLLCRASAATVRGRLERRKGSVSDADWSIYRAASEAWEHADPAEEAACREVWTEGTRPGALEVALGSLGEAGVAAAEVGPR